MCIIMHKPAGTKLPDDTSEMIKVMMDNNSDGAGIMFRAKNKIKILKGYWKPEAVYMAIMSIKNLMETDLVFHARKATHGEAEPALCHPFPISHDLNKLRALATETECAIAHNGILNEFIPNDKTISDTMSLAVTLGCFSTFQLENNTGLWKLIKNAIGSDKIIVMTPNETVKAGRWNDYAGCHFSGYGYKVWSARSKGHVITKYNPYISLPDERQDWCDYCSTVVKKNTIWAVEIDHTGTIEVKTCQACRGKTYQKRELRDAIFAGDLFKSTKLRAQYARAERTIMLGDKI